MSFLYLLLISALPMVAKDTTGLTIEVRCEYMESSVIKNVYFVNEDGGYIGIVCKDGTEYLYVKSNVISIKEVKDE